MGNGIFPKESMKLDLKLDLELELQLDVELGVWRLLQLLLQARRRLSLAPTISIFMQTITPSDLRQHRMQMLPAAPPEDAAAYGSGHGIGNSDFNSNSKSSDNGGVSIFLLRAQHLRYCATCNRQLATGNQQFSS
ncbi:hypothetical protein ACLKA6_001399 [Drosophila palustris]